MNILALDLGTKTGWAKLVKDNVSSGTWVLAKESEAREHKKLRLNRRCDPRFTKLCDILVKTGRETHFDWVVFEDVEFSKGRMQAHLWASWRAAVWAFSHNGPKIDCLSTGRLKSFATGNGNADKDQMARALTLDPRYVLDSGKVRDTLRGELLDDNAVDALHLLQWAMKTFK